MKKIKISISVISPFSETNSCVIGEFNDKTNTISYTEDDMLVNIKMGKSIIIQRSCADYTLELVFEEGKTIESLYRIKNPKMDIKVNVDTKVLRRNKMSFYIEYKLKLNEEDMGLTCIDFEAEE
ncbi:MAG: DUF1934 family protein [Bacilli bacterium]|nr:DUF1934 family protein [Bacilli bacterium]